MHVKLNENKNMEKWAVWPLRYMPVQGYGNDYIEMSQMGLGAISCLVSI